MRNSMEVRVISAVVGALIFIAVFLCGLLPLKIGAAVISIIGMYELYRAVSGRLKPVHFVGFAAEIWYVFMRENCDMLLNEFMILAAVIVLLILLIAQHEQTDIHDVSITAFGFLYVGMLMYNLVDLYKIAPYLIWLPLICAWGSDTFAYFVGVKFGKHKLAPVLSPKKSIEGSVGGVIGAGVLTVVYFLVCDRLGFIPEENGAPPVAVTGFAIGALSAAFSQVGDIAASTIKRQMNVKDYGNIMPGHGGILDRFDSVLFTAPMIYILMNLVSNGH